MEVNSKNYVHFPYKFIIRVTPAHLPKKAFSDRMMPFQMTIYEVPNTQLCQIMIMNGGQTLVFS